MAGAMLLAEACDDAENGNAKAADAPPPPEVTVAKPLIQKLTEWDEFTGRFEPVQQVEIRARVSGYLQEIGFQDGAERRGRPDAVRRSIRARTRRRSTGRRPRSRPSARS